MIRIFLFLAVINLTYQTVSLSGTIELDELSFDKIVSKFDAALVKFDIAFPYGDKHDAFVTVAKESRDVNELLVAEVGVKDYGEKDNEELAKKYGATKENFPMVKLFLKGMPEPITFDAKNGFTSDELRRFVREKSGLYLSLPGCVRQLDMLAIKFMESNEEQRKEILKEVQEIQKELEPKFVPSGKMYKTIMAKIIEKGDGFTANEFERVKKLTSGKLSEEKKKELNTRLNILQTFQLREKSQGSNKQEL